MTFMTTFPLTLERLRGALESMPAHQAAAVRVLHVADDPRSSASDLAAAVSADPVLAAQVMRLANSAYYGLSGRVSSVDFAVTVVGFATVRSISASYAAGALGDDACFPVDFWEHASATAAGAALVSTRVAVDRPDAFSVGLLHDLGAAVLCRLLPDTYRELEATMTNPDGPLAAEAERRLFGLDHASVGATVLETWRFPPEFVEAIGTHHERLPASATGLQRALAGGKVLASLATIDDGDREATRKLLDRHAAALLAAEVELSTAFELSRLVREEAAEIAATLAPGGTPVAA